MIRDEVKRLYGEKFSDRFVVHGMSGLSRLVIPPKKMSATYQPRNPENHEWDVAFSDLQQQQFGCEKLRNHIFATKSYVTAFEMASAIVSNGQSISSMIDIPFISIILKDSNNLQQIKQERERISRVNSMINERVPRINEFNLFNKLMEFSVQDKSTQMKMILDDSGLGLVMFCCSIRELDKYFPIIDDIEFDSRGSFDTTKITETKKIVSITCGEIKSSLEGISIAKEQLRKRLLAIRHTSMVIMNDAKEQTDYIMNGIIFLPNEVKKDKRHGYQL